MTERQFYEALRINERLKDFKDLKHSISNRNSLDKMNLSYVNIYKYNGKECKTIVDKMYIISDILDRHDKEIRQEIDDEIAKLKKEIEAL